jgi:hypothetical protein
MINELELIDFSTLAIVERRRSVPTDKPHPLA